MNDEVNKTNDIQSDKEFNESEIECSDDWFEDEDKTDKTDDLYVGKQFVSWQEVALFLDDYCIQKGFGYRKGRSKKDNENIEEIIKRTFLCNHAGIYESKKMANLDDQRNKTSCRVNCPWHVNISKKHGVYIVTTFVGEHKGHILNLQTVNFLPQF